jgi:hypothetical protein
LFSASTKPSRLDERSRGALPLGEDSFVLRQFECGLLACAGILAGHAFQAAAQTGQLGQQARQVLGRRHAQVCR